MAYVDYVYYQTQWGGELDQKDFTILSERASDYIDTITFNRIKENPNLMCDEVKKAVCSVVDEMQQQKTMKTKGIVKSFNNDGYSETLSYGSDSRSNARKLRESASLYLANTGLLYRGYCHDRSK